MSHPIGWVDYFDFWAKNKNVKEYCFGLFGLSSNITNFCVPYKNSLERKNVTLPFDPSTECIFEMTQSLHLKQILTTLGGRVSCQRCQARSKRTKQQCRAPAIKGKKVCKTHGGRSTGPKTEAGRQRCAEARTTHGRETRAIRAERYVKLAEIQMLDQIGRTLGFIVGPKTRNCQP